MQEILTLISNGENQTIEFKTSFQKEVVESIVAFANSDGGKVFVGVDDNDNISGIDISKESIQNYINTIKQNTIPSVIPDILEVTIDEKTVLIIDVKQYPIKPVSYKGKYYKRVKNSNHLMNSVEISDMLLKTLNLSWDAYEYPDTTIESLDINKIEKFFSTTKETGRFNFDDLPMVMLNKLSFTKNSKPTTASMLLFAKDPLRMNIRVGRFKDDITIIDDRQITDTLFEAVEDTMKFIKTYMMVSYEFNGEIKRVEKWDYPIKALREVVLNAVAHRDYREPSDTQIKIYDDKIVISSPGKLYDDMTLEKIKEKNYQSSLRNKLIAEAFYLTAKTEKYGTGFKRIEKELEEFPHITYEFKEIANAMQFTFFKNSSETNVGVNVGVNEVYDYIKSNQPTKANQIAKHFPDITQRTIERYIKQLKDEDKIIFKGSPKTGGYILK
jgi:ATP-dependent DNA helicase RecG